MNGIRWARRAYQKALELHKKNPYDVIITRSPSDIPHIIGYKIKQKTMRDNLQVGDEIVTIGGIYGRVISLKEETIVIESASDHSKLTIARWALQTNLTVHDDTVTK